MTAHEHSHPHGDDNQAPAGIETVEHLVEHLAEFMTPSTVIICVGNELCGDDGAGVAIARRLADAVPWKVFDTQTVPESFLMKIVSAKPDTFILIDALHFGAAAGAVELISPQDVGGQGPSTHGPAPLAFMELLQMMHPCRCAVLGIQPKQAQFGETLSAPVIAAIERVVQAFVALGQTAANL